MEAVHETLNKSDVNFFKQKHFRADKHIFATFKIKQDLVAESMWCERFNWKKNAEITYNSLISTLSVFILYMYDFWKKSHFLSRSLSEKNEI